MFWDSIIEYLNDFVSIQSTTPQSQINIVDMPVVGNNAQSSIISLALEGIIYGFSVCMFGATVWVLAFQRRSGFKVSYRMLIVACIMWLLSTIHMTISIVDMVIAFVRYLPISNIAPEIFLSDTSKPMALLSDITYGLQTVIGDISVIYRCYIVWNSWRVVVLPSVACIGSFGSMLFSLNYSWTKGTTNVRDILIVYCFTLVANLSATVFLAYRIWQVDRESAKLNISRSTLRPVLIVVIESGAVYSATLIFGLATINHFLAAVNSVIPAIVSITFYMIFIRLGLERNHVGTRAESSFQLSALEFKPQGPTNFIQGKSCGLLVTAATLTESDDNFSIVGNNSSV